MSLYSQTRYNYCLWTLPVTRVFSLPSCQLLWLPVGPKHVIEIILNKWIVVLDRMYRVSCYLKDDRDKSTENLRSGWRWRSFLVCDRNRCIPVKNIFPWTSIVYCEWAIIELFCVVFSLVTAVHKLDCRLVIKKDRDTCWGQDLYVFPLPSSWVLKGL
jgi:hypothetical protein